MNYPTDEATINDELNRTIYVDSLTEMAIVCKTPMVIGIHGQWGMGKTSMMKQIREQLRKNYDNKVKTVWFSPWEYQFESSPILPLLHTIREEFGITGKGKKKGMKLMNILSTLGGELLLTSLTGGKVSLKDIINLGKNYEKKYFEVKNLSKRLKSAYEADIKTLLGKPTKKLIMFIDDLDRCQPEICLKILESLSLFLNVKRCVYFMGLDSRIVESAVEMKYPNKEIKGKDYLQKIIQIPFQIPLIDDETIGSYISALSTDLSEEFESLQTIFIACVGRNPRQVKRFLNTFRLNDILARQILQDNYEREILIKLLGIQFEDTLLYGFLAEHPSRLLDMEKLLRKEEIGDEESRKFCEKYIGNERIRNILTIGKHFWEVEDVLEKYFTLTALTLGEEEQEEEIIEKVGGKKPERPFEFPLSSSLHNQTPPEENFVGREEELDTITSWYKNPDVRIGALIGWGGVGKSALVRKWYDELEDNKIRPDGIFWWGFYRRANLELFLDALLRYVSGGQIEPEAIKGTWEKVERIKEHISQGAYLIVLDGLEGMQKGQTSGEEFGCMEHREFSDMLKFLADTKSEGLCLITTRYPLTDIENYEGTVYQKVEMERLSKEDGRGLFEKVGVKGELKEIDSVIEEYEGHALSLTLLSKYLVEDFGGDITKASAIPAFYSDEAAGGKAHRILLWYAKQLTEEQSAFMKIFCLFRRTVREEDFEGVFRAEMETEFNRALKGMTELAFKRMVDNLAERRLISKEKGGTFTTPPLIKNYFDSIFEEEDKKLCHKRIYEYIGGYAPERPETLEEMQPLFEQVYHGCTAGFYDEVFDNVYWRKINKGGENFITRKLGAWETDLSLAKTFFPEGNLSQAPLVSESKDQSWLLNVAGLALLNIGRPKEAQEPISRHNEIRIELGDWENASKGYQNLADLRFQTAELISALDSAKEALDLAERARSDRDIRNSKAYLGWMFYLLGKTEEAEKYFKEADELEGKISGGRLYSIWGVFYADFLISIGKINEALELTKQNLEICQRYNWPDDISSCHRCLGAIERIRGEEKQAEEHLQVALVIARKVGMPFLEIEALLEWCRLWLDMKRYEDAVGYTGEVLKICGRTGFRFYEPEAEIVLAKAYMAQEDYEQAETNARTAYEKASGMKYRWAEGDAGHLLGEIYLAMGRKRLAEEWIKKAVGCRKKILDPKVKESETILESL